MKVRLRLGVYRQGVKMCLGVLMYQVLYIYANV